MNAPGWMTGPPRKILLATDLSPHCDRALDRAGALAAQWQSALVVLHVLEDRNVRVSASAGRVPSWRSPPDPLDAVRKDLLADVGAVADRATVLIAEGDPVEEILRTADAESCDLIVIGDGNDELLERFTQGRVVDRLLRRSRLPLLVVKDRPRKPYRHIVVATDLSDSSRHALETAARFFPDQKLTVFHAFDAPMSGLLADAGSYRRERRKTAAQECEAFLEEVGRPIAGWQPPHLLIEGGAPTSLLRDYVHDKEVDLLVLGKQERGAVLEILVGSVAKGIMDEVSCDAMVIREPKFANDR